MEFFVAAGIIGFIIWVFVANSGGSSTEVTYTSASGMRQVEKLHRRRFRDISTTERPDNFAMTTENRRILDLLNNTSWNMFLTVKAGTRRLTLLRYFRSATRKNHAVIASTAIATINVQGHTIHSIFGFKIGITQGTVRFANADKLEVLRALDNLIIDEIPMARA